MNKSEIHLDTHVYKRIDNRWHVRTNGKWIPVTDGMVIIRLNRLESMKQKPLFA